MADASHASFLPPILTFCAGAVLAVPLFRRFGLSAVLGYLAAGVVIGPSVLKVIVDADAIRGVAEIGVVLLLFIVGLELQPSRLFSMRKDIFGAGTAQLFISAVVIGLAAKLMGLSWLGAAAVGIALSLSATAIALQLLEERGDQGEHYGRRTFSVLLFQDMAIAPILALLPLLATSGGGSLSGGLIGAGIAIAAIAAVVLVGRYALNPAFRILAKAGAREVMTAAALLVVLGAALLMERAGLSMALGAFLAGVLLAESNFRHELEADIEPFRGVLLGLFFMAVGMSIDLAVVAQNWLLLLIAAPALVAVKIAIAAAILRASCSSTAEAVRAGALLSPAGEFSFVLFPLAVSLALLTPTQAALATALAAITMLIGPVVAKLIEARLAAAPDAGATIEEDFDGAGAGSIVIIGFGRFGQVVTQTMLTQRIEVTVIDKDVESIQSAARFGFRIYYGDGSRLDVLRAAGAGKAKVVAVCIDDQKAALRIVELLRSEFPQVRVIARAYDRRHAIELRKAGVDRFVRETFESALYFGRVTLETMGLSADEAIDISADVRRRDLKRLEAQAQGDLMSGRELLHTSADHGGVVPEPLAPPKQAATALNEETRAVVDGDKAPMPAVRAAAR